MEKRRKSLGGDIDELPAKKKKGLKKRSGGMKGPVFFPGKVHPREKTDQENAKVPVANPKTEKTKGKGTGKGPLGDKQPGGEKKRQKNKGRKKRDLWVHNTKNRGGEGG